DREVKPGEIMILHGNLRRGFVYPLINFAMVSESDIFGEKQKKRKKKKTQYDGKSIQNFNELSIGDYVIHENHGIGQYMGIEKITVDRVVKDYLKIRYADGGNLYVLATGLDVLQKFSSGDGRKPKMNDLNSAEWRKVKSKAKASVRLVAKELVELYAQRQQQPGYQFDKDNNWQREFEEMFPYEETEDQLSAIEATKKDMESDKVMDRLICGDVGFGKTEIAIRAAFKAVNSGKQVALLVPTTILAQQHYNTFTQRMKDFPVKIGMMSRFRTPAQQKKVLAELKTGQLDIVIGTHRLLSKDVVYRNLGLLIVDEEQRFGVTHKEKIKMLKKNVDVLTLSATPIPRTLHMSLIGIRDMSVLEEPPVDRLPIQTFIVEQNDEIIREAIRREMARNGQVFYVYNRVQHIGEIAAHIQSLVPDATVAVAHGQMSARELEKVMYRFIDGELDVLVSTTIVETGLDIANVNTLLVHDADQLGLAQLYQLRGRVGRSNRTAYAFLMYRRNKVLREVAEKRLQAMREFTELGSGFKIAMTDLEIRGAGSLLGEQQHGHMEAVGYDLYCKMLNQAIREFKCEEPEKLFDTVVDVNINAYIPATYVKSENQKLELYKRIADIENEEELQDMQEELVDRFGDMPKMVENLLNVVLLKSMAHDVFIEQVKQKELATVELTMYNEAKIRVENIPELVKKYENRLKFHMKGAPKFTFHWSKERRPNKENMDTFFANMKELFDDMKEFLLEEKKDAKE
ncbi:MAG: transcription-repair coupling factor, partial [Lachnospiraceae bacterium]|nr:transcription-repair coupling factor [Lachnospiraceae bacterium]